MKIPSFLQSLTAESFQRGSTKPPVPSKKTREMMARNAEEDLHRALARSRGLRIERPSMTGSDVIQPARETVSSNDGPRLTLVPTHVAVVSTEPVVTIPPAFRHHAGVPKSGNSPELFEF